MNRRQCGWCIWRMSRVTAKHSSSLLSAFQCIEAMQACLTQDQLLVEWRSSDPEVDTWVVEWFPDLDSEPSTFYWESVSQARNWTIQQGRQCGSHKFLLGRIPFFFFFPHQFLNLENFGINAENVINSIWQATASLVKWHIFLAFPSNAGTGSHGYQTRHLACLQVACFQMENAIWTQHQMVLLRYLDHVDNTSVLYLTFLTPLQFWLSVSELGPFPRWLIKWIAFFQGSLWSL